MGFARGRAVCRSPAQPPFVRFDRLPRGSAPTLHHSARNPTRCTVSGLSHATAAPPHRCFARESRSSLLPRLNLRAPLFSHKLTAWTLPDGSSDQTQAFRPSPLSREVLRELRQPNNRARSAPRANYCIHHTSSRLANIDSVAKMASPAVDQTDARLGNDVT